MRRKIFYAVVFLAAVFFVLGGCAKSQNTAETEKEESGQKDESGKEEESGQKEEAPVPDNSIESYGVFLGVDQESFQISDFKDYDIVVVDAQELKKEQLAQLHSTGHKVYSYLNVGSVEDSREYYERFTDLLLGRYKNWPEEDWVDVTDDRWQAFVTGDLQDMILEKDPSIDGFFLDNMDIYGHIKDTRKYQDMAEDTYDALTGILESFQDEEIPVIINGADDLVERLIKDKEASLIMGVNQETVFTRIKSYKFDKFARQEQEEQKRLTAYLKKCKKAGLEVFILEYTKDQSLAEEIREFCRKQKYHCYISEHVNLVGSEK